MEKQKRKITEGDQRERRQKTKSDGEQKMENRRYRQGGGRAWQ